MAPFPVEEIYGIVRQIPAGKVITYGDIARLIGRPQNSRMVGHTLKGATCTTNLPCHRVVSANGRLAPCWAEQRRLLEAEGVTFKKNGCVDMQRYMWDIFDNKEL